MRKLKQISLVVVIMLALSTGAMAGIIECPAAPAPAPSDQQSSLVVTVAVTLVQIAISGL